MLLFLVGIDFPELVIFLGLTFLIGYSVLKLSHRFFNRQGISSAGLLSWVTAIVLTPLVWILTIYLFFALSGE